jgi:WD40 repeat protein
LKLDEHGQIKIHQPMRILSASSDKSMMIWRPDLDTGVWINEVRVGEIGGNTLGFYGGLFGPDGKHIIAHGSNGSFHLWQNISSDEGIQRILRFTYVWGAIAKYFITIVDTKHYLFQI